MKKIVTGLLGVCGGGYFGMRYTKSPPITYDYIVVGGGTAGCTTAYYLAKACPNDKVLLIESGPKTIPNSDLESWYENWSNFSIVHDTQSPSPSYLPAPVTSHHGLGGCGTHDTRITYIPPESQLQFFSEQLNVPLSVVKKYYEYGLKLMPVASAGIDNELYYNSVVNALLKETFQEQLQQDCKVLPNSVGYVNLAMYPNETRWSSVYLLDIAPKNLHIQTDTKVNRVLFNDKRESIGVEVLGSRNSVIPVGKEVLLTAGSIGNPAILQRSGIGDKQLLEGLGIEIVCDLPYVGKGVDHPEIAVSYEWLDKWNDKETPPRGSPMFWPLAMFFRTENCDLPEDSPDIMLHFGLSPPPYTTGVTATPNCTSPKTHFMVHSTTNGTINVTFDHPSPKDTKTLAQGVRKTVEIFELLRDSGLVGNRLQPADDDTLTNDELLYDWINTHLGTAFHWSSTTKCGLTDTCVADSDFKVKQVSGLRVGSASALPEITIANPHLTITVMSLLLAGKCSGKDITQLIPVPDTSKIANKYSQNYRQSLMKVLD